MPCSLNFKRAAVTSRQNFVEIEGSCYECNSKFQAVLDKEPSDTDERILFKASYSGKFGSHHVLDKKRRLSHNQRQVVAQKLVDSKEFSSIYRRNEARNVMRFGESEPAHLPKTGSLRVAVCEERRRRRINDDPILSLYIAK